jgi:hypothetical protein
MSPDLDLAHELLKSPRYPRTAKYDPEWLVGLDMGCPTFWLLESLCEVMDLQPGMRVLDLGCGKAGGAIFLAKEFFDVVIAINSLWYFASEDLYLRHRLINFAKPGGQFGVVLPGFYNDFEGDLPDNLPEHLKPYWASCALYAWHSAEWWRHHWHKTEQVDVLLADDFPEGEGYQTYLRWERIIQYPEKLAEDDAGRNITFIRLVAQRKSTECSRSGDSVGSSVDQDTCEA